MGAIGIATRIVGRLSGKVFSRVLGPLGIALTIGECTYLGLKYSDTLDKFNNLYCNKCRSEIPRKKIDSAAKKAAVGQKFSVKCALCDESHQIEKIGEPCVYCNELLPQEEIDLLSLNLETDAHFAIRCPECRVINNLHKIGHP